MCNTRTAKLKDGRELQITIHVYPIAPPEQMTLIRLWRTEWDKTELDWLAAMNGDYSQTLAIHSAIGTIDGEPAGTATVYRAAEKPEVALVGSVLTHPDFRGCRVATHLVNTVVDSAFDAGCRVCFLSATRDPRSVYLRCGFEWWSGGVMRRAAAGFDDCESQFFAAGQVTSINEAAWGDLPGMTCLVIQPLDCLVLDYPRAIHSAKYVALRWCVSNFPAVSYSVRERGGAMCVLTGERAHRVLGFATLTPERGPYCRHKAVIDLVTHDHYDHCAVEMLDWLFSTGAERDVETVQAFVAVCDQKKLQWFQSVGLKPVAMLPGQLRIDGKLIDVQVLEGPIAS
jgi:GNAT superfamily N-acetyltransferase